ncbi:MAG: hypothetical protein AAF363_15690 [Bacteroidota bacterium]
MEILIAVCCVVSFIPLFQFWFNRVMMRQKDRRIIELESDLDFWQVFAKETKKDHKRLLKMKDAHILALEKLLDRREDPLN